MINNKNTNTDANAVLNNTGGSVLNNTHMKNTIKNDYRQFLNLYNNDNENALKIRENVKAYLLECIEQEDAIQGLEDDTYKSDDSKFNYILQRFISEYCFENNIKRFKGCRVSIMAEWLQGLAISVDFYYYKIVPKFCEILNLDKKFQDNMSESMYDFLCQEWWKFLAFHLWLLCKKAETNKILEKA